MKLKNSIVLALTSIILLLTGAASQFSYDDRSSIFQYSSSSVGTSDVAFSGTYRYITQNNSIVFEFSGDTLDIYNLRYQYGSVAYLYLDGEYYGAKTSNYSSNYVSTLAWSVTGLGSGKHQATIVCSDTYMPSYTSTSSAPRFYFDRIVVSESFDNNLLPLLQIWLLLVCAGFLALNFFSGALWRLSK